LGALTSRKPAEALKEVPALKGLVDRCRARILEVELARGDLPTAASAAAKALSHAGGLDVLVAILNSMREGEITRSTYWSDEGKGAVLSHLLRITSPEENDPQERFAEKVRALPRGRLLSVAFFAPHWARHIERALG